MGKRLDWFNPSAIAQNVPNPNTLNSTLNVILLFFSPVVYGLGRIVPEKYQPGSTGFSSGFS